MREARPRSGLFVLARMYIDIALWRHGPQDLPAVGILLPLTVSAYVLLCVVRGEAALFGLRTVPAAPTIGH